MTVMTRGALVGTAALTLLLGSSALPGSSAGGLRVSLLATAAAYRANMVSIARLAGRDTTYDYYERLLDDVELLDDQSVPAGYTAAQWSQTISRIASLDLSLARQLLEGSASSISSVRGLGEALVRSSRDGTLQPVALYVPSSYAPDRPAPLIVMLHGHPQSETALLAPLYIARNCRANRHDRRRPVGTRLLRFSGLGLGCLRRAACGDARLRNRCAQEISGRIFDGRFFGL